jgi:hypothetical protein
MELLDVVVSASVVAAVGVVVAWYSKGRFDRIDHQWTTNDARLAAIERKLHEHDARFNGIDVRFDGVETRLSSFERSLDGRFESLEWSMQGLRSDLTRVALAIGAGPATEGGGRSTSPQS